MPASPASDPGLTRPLEFDQNQPRDVGTPGACPETASVTLGMARWRDASMSASARRIHPNATITDLGARSVPSRGRPMRPRAAVQVPEGNGCLHGDPERSLSGRKGRRGHDVRLAIPQERIRGPRQVHDDAVLPAVERFRQPAPVRGDGAGIRARTRHAGGRPDFAGGSDPGPHARVRPRQGGEAREGRRLRQARHGPDPDYRQDGPQHDGRCVARSQEGLHVAMPRRHRNGPPEAGKLRIGGEVVPPDDLAGERSSAVHALQSGHGAVQAGQERGSRQLRGPVHCRRRTPIRGRH